MGFMHHLHHLQIVSGITEETPSKEGKKTIKGWGSLPEELATLVHYIKKIE